MNQRDPSHLRVEFVELIVHTLYERAQGSIAITPDSPVTAEVIVLCTLTSYTL